MALKRVEDDDGTTPESAISTRRELGAVSRFHHGIVTFGNKLRGT